jgi:hypothetical protein
MSVYWIYVILCLVPLDIAYVNFCDLNPPKKGSRTISEVVALTGQTPMDMISTGGPQQ